MVGGCAASLYKTFIIALAGEGKPYNRAYGAGKCTPIPLRGLPPEGEVLAALYFVMLMREMLLCDLLCPR